MMRKITPISYCLALLIACVEPYNFDLTNTKEVLVIDALLTDEVKSHYVKLTLTTPLDGHEELSVTGATVWVEDQSKVQIPFTEQGDGVYLTDPSVAGTVGNSYTLHVETVDGRSITSSPEILLASHAVDSIYGQYVEMPSTEDDSFLVGIQFLLDTHDSANDYSDYRFEYMEDYEVRVPYPSLFEWSGVDYSPREDRIGICYVRDIPSIDLFAATTKGQNENRLAEYPLRLVEQWEDRLKYRYSLRVKQYSISSSAYQYYKNLKENNESSGSFFDKQKGTVAGNVYDSNSLENPVLGYFEVSGVSEIRRVFTSSEFRDAGFNNKFRIGNCEYDQVADSVSVDDLASTINSGQHIWNFTFPVPNIAILMPITCSDCRLYGELEKPDFWD